MSNADTITCRDLHLRHTDVNGASYVQCHRVWDADRFFNARSAETHRANLDAKPPSPRLANVELLTREQYLAARKP